MGEGKDRARKWNSKEVRLGNWREAHPVTSSFMFLQLAESDFASTFRLLTVFAYGTYADYLGNLRGLELWSSGGGRRAIFGRT